MIPSMTRAAILAVPLLLALVAPAAGQVPFDRDRDQAVGVVAGLASGAGFAYEEVLPSAWGFRGSVLAWKKSDYSFVDLGLSGLRILSDDGRRRVYLVGGAAWWRKGQDKTEDVFDDQGNLVTTRTVHDIDDSVGIGAGVGIDLPLGGRAAVSLEGVFTYWTDTGDLLPLPQIGLHYHF